MKRPYFLLRAVACCAGFAFVITAFAEEPGISVSRNFPGGSGEVKSVDSETQHIEIVPSPGPGWDNWWYVRVDGLRPGEEVALDLEGDERATPRRAVFSTDNQIWHHTEPGTREENRTIYRQKATVKTMWFAWGPPFVLGDAQKLVHQLAESHPFAEAFELTHSKEGRSVPALRVKQPGGRTRNASPFGYRRDNMPGKPDQAGFAKVFSSGLFQMIRMRKISGAWRSLSLFRSWTWTTSNAAREARNKGHRITTVIGATSHIGRR